MADAALQLSQLEHGVRHFLAMAKRRHLAETSRCLARENTATSREEIDAYCGYHRQSIGTHSRRRTAARIRCGQEDSRSEATSGRGYARADSGRRRSWSRLARPRRCLLGVGITESEVSSSESNLWRCSLWSGEPPRLCERHVRLDSANDFASGRTERLCGLAETLDCGANFCLAGSVSSSQQGLREDHRIQRSVHLHRHDCSHVQTPRTTQKLIFKTRSNRGE